MGVVPGFAEIQHVGRRSGRPYRTPVFLFRDGDRRLVALTYGPGTEWVRNVLAAGEAVARTRGGVLRLDQPDVVAGGRVRLPPPARWALRAVGAHDVLAVRAVAAGDGDGRQGTGPVC